MATAARIVVSTTPVALNTVSPSGQTLVLKNVSANACDLGPAGVTAGGGYDLAGGAVLEVAIRPGDQVFAVRTAAADATLAILRT
jgi:hypothetical protein